MNRKARASMRSVVRPGDVAIPVDATIVPLPSGKSAIKLNIDLARTPIPERRYAADVAGLVYDGHQVKLLFGQRKLTEDALRSLIVVPMSTDAVHRFLTTCTAFIPDTEQFVHDYKVDTVPLLELKEEPEQTIALAANLIVLARAGREATMDFYHLSAASLHMIRQNAGATEIGVDPVVRVELSVAVLLSLLTKLESLSATLPEATT